MKLSDKVTVFRPNTTSREFFDCDNGIKCVHYGDVYKNYSGKTIDSSAIINRFAKNVADAKVLNCDSIIVPDVTETVADWGHFVYIRYDGTPYINGTHTFALTCNSAVTLRYLFRYLTSERTRFRLQTLLNGSTVFQINIANFNSFELQNYHENEQTQQHIVDILGSLDDKVEFNQKLVANIQALALSIYKSMFAESAEFVLLEDVATVTMGQAPIGSSYNECGNGMPLFQGCADFGDLFPENRIYTPLPTRIANTGDVLLSVRAPVGDLNIASSKCCIGRGLSAITNTHGFKNNAVIYYALIAEKNKFEVFNGSGTVFGSINKNELNALALPFANREMITEYDKRISALFEKCIVAMQENIKLAELKTLYLKKFFN